MYLFPHNQCAYENALSILKTQTRVCIIHPTGTGKAVIIGKFISDHPGCKHLLLAPGLHILREIQKHALGVQFAFRTYQSVGSGLDISNLSAFDFIYLDEFHRLGADIWGGGIRDLLSLNAQAKVIGTSATHIRYLDDQRNMATELFSGNIASKISLTRAIADGILRGPKYVSALYSIHEELSKVEEQIAASANDDKTGLIQKIRSEIIDWEKSSGLDLIIKKHLPVDRKRIIVFCRDLEHLTFAEKTLAPIFEKIYRPVRSLVVHSKKRKTENESAMRLFSSNSDCPTVLYSIDMVNEGLHAKGCDTVFLLRETTSPIIFYQQIGRAFSVSQTDQPLIFDLVNNFKNLQIEAFRLDYEREVHISKEVNSQTNNGTVIRSGIEFIDETQDLRAILESFETGQNSWNSAFNEAKAFQNARGHLYPPGGTYLAQWVNGQRYLWKKGKLPEEKCHLLSSIGMNWDAPVSAVWLTRFNQLKLFIQEKGRNPLPMSEPSLHHWLRIQRKRLIMNQLNATQIAMLRQTIDLDVKNLDARINERTDRLIEHFSCGSMEIGKGQIMRDLSNMRYLHNKGMLNPEVIKRLLDGKVPLVPTADFWLKRFTEFELWVKTHKRLPSPSIDPEEYNWYAKNKGAVGRDELREDRAALFKNIVEKYKRQDAFEENCIAIVNWMSVYGDRKEQKENHKLLFWIYKHKSLLKRGILDDLKKNRLLSIKGIDWCNNNNKSNLREIFGAPQKRNA